MAKRLTAKEKKIQECERRMYLPHRTEADKSYYAGQIRVFRTDMDSTEDYASVMNDAANWINSDDINLRAKACGIYSEVWPFSQRGHTQDYRFNKESA